MKLQVLYWIHFYFIHVYSLQHEQPHVCWNPSSRHILYCCAEYENINETCITCKLGFTSHSGKPCLPCENNYYGKKCLEECECLSYQRCDHVLGCLSKSNAFSSSVTYDIHNSTSRKDDELKTTQSYDKTESGDDSFGNLNIYSAVTTGVIVIILIILVYNRCKRYNHKYKPPSRTDQSKDLESNIAENVMEYLTPESTYHTIDDAMLATTIHDTNATESKCTVRSFKSESCEYHPYDEPDEVESSNVNLEKGVGRPYDEPDEIQNSNVKAQRGLDRPYDEPDEVQSSNLKSGNGVDRPYDETDDNPDLNMKSGGLVCSVDNSDNSYLHPYQPLVNEKNSLQLEIKGNKEVSGKVHGYSSLTKVVFHQEESSSSVFDDDNENYNAKLEECKQTKIASSENSDGKLNPYQPLKNKAITDKSHEYNKIETGGMVNFGEKPNPYQPLQNESSVNKNYDYTQMATSEMVNSSEKPKQYHSLQNKSSINKNVEYTQLVTTEMNNSNSECKITTSKKGHPGENPNPYQPLQKSVDKNLDYTKIVTSANTISDEQTKKSTFK